VAISITIGLIVMVGALNIISSLILLVRQKSRDIAILKTMGASSRRVMGIFMMQGVVIGGVGTTVGALSGLALCWFGSAPGRSRWTCIRSRTSPSSCFPKISPWSSSRRF
jgi:ABC-type lipoprotein release transport system permease subunit